MKYVLLVVAVLVLVWLLRGARRPGLPSRPAADRADAKAQPMVACQHCGVHLPQHDALPGRGGVFCTEAHRAAYERQHPPA
ncbi:PP0621 family protein [Variovorax sp. YR752]|uniref:PP0621 family protein n=1 Tax=Variovorax sp. YR752 TaxID=1884383 RepID=UPI003137D451